MRFPHLFRVFYKQPRWHYANFSQKSDMIQELHNLYAEDKKSYWWHVFLLEGKALEQKELTKTFNRWLSKYKQLEDQFKAVTLLTTPFVTPMVDYKELLTQIPTPPELWSIGIDVPPRNV